MCDWNSHQFVNLQKENIVLSNNFCRYVVDEYLPVLKAKYNQIYKFLLTMDELLELLTGKNLFEDKDKQVIHKYDILVQKCVNNPQQIENCIPMC